MNSGLWRVDTPSLRKTRPISNTFSKPATVSRFRYSSGAILRYRSRSSALWWVVNGRALAPPGIGWKMGVSTSIAPRSSKKERVSEIIRLLVLKASRASGVTQRSTYRCRYLVSVSLIPCHLSGKGRRASAKRTQESTRTLSSPRRVVMTTPVTPNQSPRFRSQNSSKSGVLLEGANSWIRPEPSSRVPKANLP